METTFGIIYRNAWDISAASIARHSGTRRDHGSCSSIVQWKLCGLTTNTSTRLTAMPSAIRPHLAALVGHAVADRLLLARRQVEEVFHVVLVHPLDAAGNRVQVHVRPGLVAVPVPLAPTLAST